MSTELQETLDHHAECLMLGKFDEALPGFRFPFVMHIEDRLGVYQRQEDWLRGLNRMRAILRSNGVRRMLPRVRLVDQQTENRFRLWVMVRFEGDRGPMFVTAASICYGRNEGAGNVFEMLHITHPPFPDLRQLATEGTAGGW